LPEAIISFDKALELKPDWYEAWKYRGITLRKLERFQEAIASFNKAIKIKSDDYGDWNNQGYMLLKLRHCEDAIASFNKALELKPDYADAFYNRACCYALQGDIKAAIDNLQKAINLSPEQYLQMGKNDSDFDSIRENEQFQSLIQTENDWEDEEEIDEQEWLKAAASNPVFNFLKDP
ncbi:MAG: TPR end-of-group domain-containing protein, partial [Nostoc sp.]